MTDSRYLTITIKREVAERAREKIGHGGIKSLSDFVEKAVVERLEREGSSDSESSGDPSTEPHTGAQKPRNAAESIGPATPENDRPSRLGALS